MKHFLDRILVIGVLFAATAAPARADGPRVGVVIATRVNVTEGEADALAAELGEALRDQVAADVVAGRDARRRLPAGGLQEDCVARPACADDVAERLGADQLLFLVVVRIGPRVQVDATWTRPRTDQVASRAAMVIEDGVQASAVVFARAARRLLPDARPRLDNPPLRVEARPRGRHLTPAAGVFGAASVAALAGGIGLALSARSDYSDLESSGCDQMPCPGVDDRVDAMEKKALAADILFGASAVAAGVAVFLYLGSGSSERAPVSVGADSHGAQVWLGGQF